MYQFEPEWVNPEVLIKLFANTVKRGISDISQFSDFVKKRDLKVTTEAWRAAMYLVALSRITGTPDIYMQYNPKDPPDFFGLQLYEQDDLVKGYVLEIEVFQVPDESPLSLIQEIQKKVAKYYSKNTVLVCQIRKSGFHSTLGEIHEQITELKPKNDIWIIGGASPNGLSDHIVAQVYPEVSDVRIDITEILDKEVEQPFIRASRGRQKKLQYEMLGHKLIDTRFTIQDLPKY